MEFLFKCLIFIGLFLDQRPVQFWIKPVHKILVLGFVADYGCSFPVLWFLALFSSSIELPISDVEQVLPRQ